MAAAEALRARMSELSLNKYALLEKSVHRMEYTRIQEERKRMEVFEVRVGLACSAPLP
jgi:hypothetical protein